MTESQLADIGADIERDRGLIAELESGKLLVENNKAQISDLKCKIAINEAQLANDRA